MLPNFLLLGMVRNGETVSHGIRGLFELGTLVSGGMMMGMAYLRRVNLMTQ